jgi:hypothetical protein
MEEEKAPSTEKLIPLPVFAATLRGGGVLGVITVSFEDLCGPCHRTVRALLDQISKRIDGVSPDRKAAPKKPAAKEKGAANGATPHPTHSAAAGSPAAKSATRSST